MAMNSRTLHELKSCQERAALSVIRKLGDDIDYRAMLAREDSHRKFAGCYERPGQWVTRMAEYASAGSR